MLISDVAPPDHRIVAQSGLFAEGWYRQEYNLTASDLLHPLAEYCQTGWREGRAPNPYFDAAWYVSTYPEVMRSGLHPLTHFVLSGDTGGFRPGPFFETAWYRDTHNLPAGASALAHFLRRRTSGAVAPVPDFEPVQHLRLYPEIVLRGIDPYLHWRGLNEDARPDEAEIIRISSLFDATFYLVCNPDVREARQDPLQHFCASGWREGRNPNLYFHTNRYMDAAGTRRAACENPLVHYYLCGELLGLVPSPYFNPGWYVAYYALPRSHSALAHYLARRRTQRYSPNPAFDVVEYVSLFGHMIGLNRDAFAHSLRFPQ